MSLEGFSEQDAVVVAVEGRIAWVEAQRQSVCGQCAAAKGCGTATLGKAFRRRPARIAALNPIGARVGERVVVGIRSRSLVQGAWMVYGLPLLALFAVPLTVQAVFLHGAPLPEGWQILLAALGLGGALWWVRHRGAGSAGKVQAVVLRRCSEAGAMGAPVQFHDRIGERHG